MTAKRTLKKLKLNYRINNGKTKTVDVSEWKGGERYGHENKRYYAEFRGEVRRARRRPREGVVLRRRASTGRTGPRCRERAVHLHRQADTGAKVLVLANEDYTGYNPDEPPYNGAPRISPRTWTRSRPRATAWTSGTSTSRACRTTSACSATTRRSSGTRATTTTPRTRGLFIDTAGGTASCPTSACRRQQYLTIAVRDSSTGAASSSHGRAAQDYGLLDPLLGGLFYGLNGDPDGRVRGHHRLQGIFDDCLIMANDFRQYYLGAYTRVSLGGPTGFTGIASPIAGLRRCSAAPREPARRGGHVPADQRSAAGGEFPQFRSQGAAQYDFTGGAFAPAEGNNYAAAVHADESYMRLTKTFDLRRLGRADPRAAVPALASTPRTATTT